MNYFPAFLKLKGRACLVVGGGAIAYRKIRLLDSAGARLTIVAPEISTDVRELAVQREFTLIERTFRASDIRGQWLVVSATGDAAVEVAVYREAERAGVFCNGVDSIENCSYITPAIVDRSPVVIAISSAGTAPVLARKIRAEIEARIPAGLAKLAQLSSDWRDRVRRRFSDIINRRRYWEAVFDGPAASLAVSGAVNAAELEMQRLLDSNELETRGEAWLVGAGPGDPGLLTLRALQAMQAADVILHDRLVSDEVLQLARRDADIVSVGKTPGCALNSQEEINARLVELVRSGRRVCRLKGGDPFIFGRGGEEAEALAAAGLSYQVVPGITAAAGCAASAGIPLTHRDHSQSVALVTAHGKDSIENLDWPALAREKQTLTFYMGVRRYPQLMNNLIDNGRSADTPIAIIEKGTLPDQRLIRGTLGQLNLLALAHKVQAPAILVVGEVAALGREQALELPRAATNCATPDSRITQKG